MKNHSHYTINNNKHKLGNIKKNYCLFEDNCCQYEKEGKNKARNCEYAFYTLTNTNIILVISVQQIRYVVIWYVYIGYMVR